MSETRVPVVVIGAGLSGLAAATFLGLHGVSALLVERHRDLSNQPKARGQFPSTMEALRVAGLADEFRAATDPGGLSIYVAASVSGPVFTEILGMDLPDVSELSAGGWADVSQERAERILARRARELGAELRFSTAVESLSQDDAEVTVVLRDLDTDETGTVHADYLIAADGHASPIRGALGIGTHGRGVLGESAGTLFEADLSSVITTRTALYNLQNPDLPGGGGAVVTTDLPGRYVLNTGLENGALPSPRRWIELIRIATGMPGLHRLVPSADRIFQVSHRIADRFSDGRVFLVGDAGKVMPPTGGAGGNVAILDSFHLAWKLAMVVRGEAGPGLLASHDPERQARTRTRSRASSTPPTSCGTRRSAATAPRTRRWNRCPRCSSATATSATRSRWNRTTTARSGRTRNNRPDAPVHARRTYGCTETAPHCPQRTCSVSVSRCSRARVARTGWRRCRKDRGAARHSVRRLRHRRGRGHRW